MSLDSRMLKGIRPYRFENTRAALSVPAFDTTSELLTSIIYSVVIVLVMNWSCQAVAEHAFCERTKQVDGVLFKESRSGGAVSLGLWDIRIGWGSELEEFVLGYGAPQSAKAIGRTRTSMHEHCCTVVHLLTSCHSSQALSLQLF